MATKSDKILGHLVVLLVVPAAINLTTAWLSSQWRWVGYFLAAGLAASILLTMPDGFLSPRRYGQQRIGKWVAVAGTASYLTVTAWVALGGARWWMVAFAAGCLWVSSTLLVWSSLIRVRRRLDVASALATLLVGTSYALYGVSRLHSGDSAAGVGNTLIGIGLLVTGVRVQRLSLQQIGWAPLLVGIGDLVGAVASLGSGDAFSGIARFLRAIAFILAGLGILRRSEGYLLLGFATYTAGWVFESIDSTLRAELLPAAGDCIFTAASLLFLAVMTVYRRRGWSDGMAIVIIAGLILQGAGIGLWGIDDVVDGRLLSGVALSVFSIAAIASAVACLWARHELAEFLRAARRYFLGK
jgi:hypothetical protein